MEYREEDYLMLSGIQHFAFCRRQWALIHIEQQWAENERTVEGNLVHKRAHDPFAAEKSKDVIVSRAMPVASRTMGVSGSCDIVEFCRAEDGVQLRGHRGLFHIFPVEYKRGKPKETNADLLQLTAQAMCLEEMFCTQIPEGAIFYSEIKRRVKVSFTEELREQVVRIFAEMHKYYDRKYTPRVKWSKSCNACSLKDLCLPKLGKASSAKQYIADKIREESKQS